MTSTKLEAKSSHQPIWESSRRPLHPKCVWIESYGKVGGMNGGHRHFIFDHSVTNTYRPRSDTSSLIDSFSSSFTLEKTQSFDLMENKMGRLSIIGSGDKKQNSRTYSSLSDRSNVMNYIFTKDLQLPCDDGDDDDEDNVDQEFDITNLGLMASNEIESNNNLLADRVLQWLDLAGSQSYITTRQSDQIGKNLNAPKRRSVTAKEHRTYHLEEIEPKIRMRREPVRQSSLTFNADEFNEFQSPNQKIVSIRFGDLFPTTYKCSRKFLALRQSKCAIDALESLDLQSSHPLHTKNKLSPRKFNGKGKIKRFEYFDDQYRSMIQRQILETSCNTQAAKRQLHIFMPNLPKKNLIVNEIDSKITQSEIENDSCLSANHKTI